MSAVVANQDPTGIVVIPYWLTYPGTWVDLPDSDVAFNISRLLSLIESKLTEAAVSLGAYIASKDFCARSIGRPETWQQNSDARLAYALQVKAEWGIGEFDFARRYLEIQAEVGLRRLKDAFAANVLPEAYIRKMPFLHANGFLNAVHTIRQALRQCSKISAVQAHADAAGAAIEAALPKLKGVRDSAAHVDERVQGMAKKKKIPLQPIQSQLAPAPIGGVLFTGSLIEDNFGNTMEDGTYGEVPVTTDTFNFIVGTIQAFIDRLPWRGPPKVVPQL